MRHKKFSIIQKSLNLTIQDKKLERNRNLRKNSISLRHTARAQKYRQLSHKS